jgi:hypothetical protein
MTMDLQITFCVYSFLTASVVYCQEFLATNSEVWVRFPALPDFMRSSGSGTGSTQPREELLGRNSSGSGLENREYGRGDPLRWPRDTLYPQTLALTSPTRGGRLRTKATEFVLFVASFLKLMSKLQRFFLSGWILPRPPQRVTGFDKNFTDLQDEMGRANRLLSLNKTRAV